MTPIQQLLLGTGSAKDRTYIDDIFSLDLWAGSSSSKTITNGIDLSGEGGLTWVKARNYDRSNNLYDTVRGANKIIKTDSNLNEAVRGSGDSKGVDQFNNNGFTLGAFNDVNATGYNYSAMTFRKTPGFFDIVTWTGNSSYGQTISHSLGCIPGMIITKCTSHNNSWYSYHRWLDGGNQPETHILTLNSYSLQIDSTDVWADTAPTASNFEVGSDLNEENRTYIAYLFAGGESTAATARSVDFDGTGDYLEIPDHADFDLSNSNFTVECWVKGTEDGGNRNIVGQWSSGNKAWSVFWGAANQGHSAWGFKYSTDNSNETQVSDILLDDDQWHHIAVVRDGNDLKLYRDGILRKNHDISSVTIYNSSAHCRIANDGWDSPLDCHISNVRLVKGSVVYTSSFKVPTEPLSNITNTKLLCCNGTSTTSSTVTPGTITANGDPTSSTITPFDDPAAFTFGDAGDQGVIKCGSFEGNANADGPEINLGWEPQWVLLKNSDAYEHWVMFDSMRGIANGDDSYDERLWPSQADNASAADNYIDLTPTGFKISNTDAAFNGNGQTTIYVAIRRQDGYVGKPIATGTDVFAMDTGAGGTTIPNYDSGFPVDMAFDKKPDSVAQWYLSTRLTGTKYLRPDENSSVQSQANYKWDSNVGWGDGSWQDSTYQSWMFRRHAGFDVLTYVGNSVTGRQTPHSLSKTPEMIWVKNASGENWAVYHKGLNGGTNPHLNEIWLNSSNSEQATDVWNDTAPTSTHFSLNNDGRVNETSANYTAILFASVPGVSKVGRYTGAGSSDKTVTVGFQPRLIIIKNADSTTEWGIYDTLRGINSSGSGGDHFLYLNETNAQWDDLTHIDLTSTGFTLKGNSWNGINQDSNNFIYYAHA